MHGFTYGNRACIYGIGKGIRMGRIRYNNMERHIGETLEQDRRDDGA